MGPQNGIVGNDYGIDLPETQIDEETQQQQVAAARFSKTKEYQALKKHLEERIEFYQAYLPSGNPIVSLKKTKEEIGNDWVVANTIIAEFKAVIGAYEQAAEYAKGKNG